MSAKTVDEIEQLLAEHLSRCSDCHRRDMRSFGHSMCPRGTVLARRLEHARGDK